MNTIFIKGFGHVDDNEANRELLIKQGLKNDSPKEKPAKSLRANVKRIGVTGSPK